MRPEIISFAGGLPDPDSFPSRQISEIISRLLAEKGDIYLQYGASRGSQEGISASINRVSRRGIKTTADEIIMASGSQQVIDLVSKVLVDPGNIILVENPTFVGALGVFRNTRGKIIGVPQDDEGIHPGELVKILEVARQAGDRVKMLYVIPNFQNPTGKSMSLKRRQEVLQVAEEYDFLILEDDAYGELWFEGGLEQVKPIKAFDKNHRVIYTSSFSKIISPGIRLAWTVAAPALIERLDMAKQMADVCCNPLMQGVAYDLCNGGFLDEHIEALRGIYHSRCRAMLHALAQHMPEGVTWTQPNGGFYIWVTLPAHVDTVKMLAKAIDHNVAYVVGSAFYADGSGKNTLRISFCHEKEAVIEEGIQRLSRTVRGMLAV
jgi:2-aminoadipate transaminase